MTLPEPRLQLTVSKSACHLVQMHRELWLIVLLALAQPAVAKICRYIDADGNVIYSNVSPPKGMRLLDCEVADGEKQAAALGAASRVARAKLKIGMTEAQMRAADPLLRRPANRKVVESTSGVDEWLEFYDFTVHLHNGRVATISY